MINLSRVRLFYVNSLCVHHEGKSPPRSAYAQLTAQVLVCGGAGYIGSHIVRELTKLGTYQVVVLDNLSTGAIRFLAILTGESSLSRPYASCPKEYSFRKRRHSGQGVSGASLYQAQARRGDGTQIASFENT